MLIYYLVGYPSRNGPLGSPNEYPWLKMGRGFYWPDFISSPSHITERHRQLKHSVWWNWTIRLMS